METVKIVPQAIKAGVSNRGDAISALSHMHLRFIDGIRAAAALYVVLGHAYFEPANGYYPSRWMTRLGLAYGHLAVDVFIVVSGFCLMLPVARHGGHLGSLKTFFSRRARRILPAYYAALAFSILFIITTAYQTNTGTIWDVCPPVNAGTVWRHLFLIHDLTYLFARTLPAVKNGQINYPLWSIAVETQVYLFMPLVVASLRKWGNAPTLCWTILFGLLLDRWLGDRVADACPWYLGLFCCGAVAAREAVIVTGPANVRWRFAAYGTSVLTVIAVLAVGNQKFRAHPMLCDDLAGVATALLLYVLFTDAAQQNHRLSRVLAWPPLVSIGLFSYSLYLVHAPLLHACYLIIHHLIHVSTTVMFALLLACVPFIVLAAYGFHLVFERPFLPTRR